MINESVLHALRSEGMISEGDDATIDLSTYDIDQVIRETLEAHADLLLEMDDGRIDSKHPGDNSDENRFLRLMQAKAERQASMKDGPALKKNKQNLARVLRHGHFLILSASRGMNYADKDWEGRKERKIAQADDRVKAGVFDRNPNYKGGDFGSTHDEQGEEIKDKDIVGATQVIGPGDNPDSSRFGRSFGRGKDLMAIGGSAQMPRLSKDDPLA